MTWLGHIADMIFPEATKSARTALTAFRGRRRKERNRFVLKAMTAEPGRLTAPVPGSVRYDLATIDRRLSVAQWEHPLGDVPMFPEDPVPLEKQQSYQLALQHQLKIGLPTVKEWKDVSDAERTKKVEAILHEMVDDGLLAFHPPNMWVVK